MSEIKKNLTTDCGMFGIWDKKYFEKITSYEEWENEFIENEDIEKNIEQSTFVPIYIHTDGTFQFKVKYEGNLDEREEKNIINKSKEYLFKTEGESYLSGIEYIESNVDKDRCLKLDLEKGIYSIQMNTIAWDNEPDAFLPNGDVSENALSDCVVIIKKIDKIDKDYKKDVETFK